MTSQLDYNAELPRDVPNDKAPHIATTNLRQRDNHGPPNSAGRVYRLAILLFGALQDSRRSARLPLATTR